MATTVSTKAVIRPSSAMDLSRKARVSPVALTGNFMRGQALRMATPASSTSRATVLSITAEDERIRLHNLSPLPNSRTKKTRKGRGHAAGQGQTCGFGNRGQKSRAGPGVRPGFEGGQMPLYRIVPKLKGIAGGMSAGKKKCNIINFDDLEKFSENEEVSMETLIAKGVFNLNKKDKKMPLKVLGDGELTVALNFKAAKFSAAAKEKIEAAGGSIEVVALKPKWTREAHEARVAAAAA